MAMNSNRFSDFNKTQNLNKKSLGVTSNIYPNDAKSSSI